MAEAIIMPRQGQSVESCIFSEWFVKKGEQVRKGEILFSYETDKAAFEQEAPADGTLLEIFAQAGDEIPVLQTIGVLGAIGEPIDHLLPNDPAAESVEVSGKDFGERPVRPEFVTVAQQGSQSHQGISPRAKKMAVERKIDRFLLLGSGPGGRIIERDIYAYLKDPTKATPLARSIAASDNISLPRRGSGIGGKVIATDLRQASAEPHHEEYADAKISNIRKIIAANMHASLANTAQLTLHTSADARKILAERKLIKKKLKEGYEYNITINDMVSFVLIKALQEHPPVNVHFLEGTIRSFNNVHLGFAVDTEKGLVVPTVHRANELTLEELSGRMKELAVACQSGKINPEVLKGATFTITNLGGLGIEVFTPILNPPQAGILGVNTITPQPTELDDGAFGFVPKIGLSLTFDHRALDGAPAARFLQCVAGKVANFDLRL
jgi:pyruvate dehydrogenase E2 component (dihydrolipoamide acetyltransferase)